jgi:CopG family nickel-responsive transcriptional regulator
VSEVLRFGVSIESKLLDSFDRLIGNQGYATRSEALRDLIRDALVRARLDETQEDCEVIGSLSLTYDRLVLNLVNQMADLKHVHSRLVVSAMNVQISQGDCMEVIVLRGPVNDVRALANILMSLKGVKHGRLFTTVPSQAIIEGDMASHINYPTRVDGAVPLDMTASSPGHD